MANQNMVDVAYNILSKKVKPVKFARLWTDVVGKLKLNMNEADELIAEFYTAITMDGRLVNLGDNVWTLRSKMKYDKIKTVIENDDEDEILEEEEDLDFSLTEDSSYKTDEGFNLNNIEEESEDDEAY